ncbi:Ribosome inactivating protein [Amycolatopsis tolypomycina]|uniref:Ribosome inactivating protein n=1 Tax=Amycolatopsis tolypomycina TaxID=208445 RepID=A0A1H4Y2Q3_9PSEU|nr:ribosome-inactivating family protein [Amycolatopsis tolypomycina]SED12183.1 Ribosome inactivating protein [Amycolatopsis tolypomycina]
MSHPDVTTAAEPAVTSVKKPAPARAFRRLLPTTFLAATLAVATLVSEVHIPATPTVQAGGVPGSSQSSPSIKLVQDQTPIFWWNGSRWDYFGFINAIRRSMNVYNNYVPGSSNTIDHTDPWNRSGSLDVVVGSRNGHQVRIRLRRSDMYVLGWFDRNGTYQYLGNWTEANGPGGSNIHQALDTPSYDGIERMANLGNPGQWRSRYTARFNQDVVSASADNLWNADFNHPELIGQALLVLVQFISEATRFRGISDTIGWGGFADRSADNWQFNTNIPSQLVDMENNWGQLSERFDWMLENNAQDSPGNAFTGFWRNPDGSIASRLLITMADYGLVFNLVKGFPGRRQ